MNPSGWACRTHWSRNFCRKGVASDPAQGTQDFAVVEGMLHTVDLLILFVAFARHKKDVVFSRQTRGQADGLCPVGFDPDIRPVRDACQDLFDNGRRILRTRIVAGDECQVGAFRRSPAHTRTFRAVPVAAAAEDGEEPSAGLEDAAQGVQHAGEGVVRVRIVHKGESAGGESDGVEPSRCGWHGFRRFPEEIRGESQCVSGRDGFQQIGAVVGAAQRTVPAEGMPVQNEIQGGSVIVGGEIFEEAEGMRIFGGEVQFVSPGLAEQPHAPRVAGIDDRGRAGRRHGGEQELFRLVIVFHVFMVVQVVAGEIREDRRGEFQRARPMLVQSVAGGFHDGIRGSAVPDPPEQILESGGIGHGDEGIFRGAVAGFEPDRADQRGLPVRRPQNVTEREGDGGLAVGAGDGVYAERIRRAARSLFTQNAPGKIGVRDPEDGTSGRNGPRPVGGNAEGDGAPPGGLLKEGMSVGPGSPYGTEERAGSYAGGIVADTDDIGIARAGIGQDRRERFPQTIES